MEDAGPSLLRRLRREILFARERVYHAGQPTPLERLAWPGGPELWVKREDLGPIKAYKWRGAYNRMAGFTPAEAARGVVTASAGNHAQGVALAARLLGLRARIHMPRSTPQVKVDAVHAHGGAAVEIQLSGDSYDDAVEAARADCAAGGAVYVHAYDDLAVMAGQGTLADEVVLSGRGPFDVALVQIGGGGLAAGVGAWLKSYWPAIRIIGVEGEGQASMRAALAAGKPVRLDSVDLFCDGTAVREAGAMPFEICREILDEVVTVSNAEVAHGMRLLWEGLRSISEPAGAMGVAAAWRLRGELAGKKVLAILCGANIDFLQIGLVAQSDGAAGRGRRVLRIGIPEAPGSMLRLLDHAFDGLDIVDFQYGKQDHDQGWPVIAVAAADPLALAGVGARLAAAGFPWEDLTGALDVAFRAIPLRGDLLSHPLFLALEFYERPGALHQFLDKVVRGKANFCYFNYRQSGERIGRALIGLEFDESAGRAAFLAGLPPRGDGFRACRPVDEPVHRRLVGGA
jgi:threonine dehydratase